MYILMFVLGTTLGSFYNVVGYRLPLNQSLITPGSHCPKCNHELKWYELIPILSFLIQKGRCRSCGCKISLFYPFIELSCGLLFVISYYSWGLSYELIIALVLVSLLMVITVSDLNFYIIPDEVLLVSGIIIIIVNYLNKGFIDGSLMIAGGLGMFAIMYALMIFGNFIFKRESLGGGDIKLMLVLGMCLPFIMSLISVVVGSMIALPVAIIIFFINREKIIPFGPFLVIGTLLVFLLKIDTTWLINLLV